MNSDPVDTQAGQLRLRALRDLDLVALPQLFPECRTRGLRQSDWHAWLRDVENIAWGKNPRLRLVLEETETGRSVAGFTFVRSGEAVATLHYGFRRTTAATQIAGFALAREFAHTQMHVIVLRTDLVSGQDPLAASHASIGYREAVRLREWWRDGDDLPHDLITYEAVNPEWERTR